MIEIFHRVGLSDFRELGGLIGASKTCRSLTLTVVVLKDANLTEVIRLGHHVCLRSPYHPFFNRCFLAGNPADVLMEEIRLSFTEYRLDDAIGMLETCMEPSVYTYYVRGMLHICGGDYDIGCVTLEKMQWWEDVPASTSTLIANTIRQYIYVL